MNGDSSVPAKRFAAECVVLDEEEPWLEPFPIDAMRSHAVTTTLFAKVHFQEAFKWMVILTRLMIQRMQGIKLGSKCILFF